MPPNMTPNTGGAGPMTPYTPPTATNPAITPVHNVPSQAAPSNITTPPVNPYMPNTNTTANPYGNSPAADAAYAAAQKMFANQPISTPPTGGTTATTAPGGTSGGTATTAPGGSTPSSSGITTPPAGGNGLDANGNPTGNPAMPVPVDYSTDPNYLASIQAQKDASNPQQFNAQFYAQQIAAATAQINQKYAALQQQAQTQAVNDKAARFSNLAGEGVNPLNSGANNVAGDVQNTLNLSLSNLAQQQSAEIAQATAQLQNQQSSAAAAALQTAKDTADQIRQSSLDKNAQSQTDYNNLVQKNTTLAAENQSNYTYSQTQKADAGKTINDTINNAPNVYKNMSAEGKAALEKRAGLAAGYIDATIAANDKTASDAVAKAAATALAAEKKDMTDKGYLYVKGPSGIKDIPAGSKVTYGANGAMYYLPPTVDKSVQVSSGASLVNPNTGHVIYNNPKAATGSGSGSTPTDYTSQLAQLKASIDQTPNTPGSYHDNQHANSDVFKSMLSGIKSPSARTEFVNNFGYMLNPSDSTVAQYAKGAVGAQTTIKNDTTQKNTTAATMSAPIKAGILQHIKEGHQLDQILNAYSDVNSNDIIALWKANQP